MKPSLNEWRSWAWGLSCLISVFVFPVVGREVSSTVPASPALIDRKLVEIETNQVCGFTVFLQDTRVASSEEMPIAPKDLAFDCIHFSQLSGGRAGLRITASCAARVAFRRSSDWECRLGPGQAINLFMDCTNHVLGVMSEKTNRSVVVFKLGEGAVVSLQPGAVIHYDRLNDGSYFITGNGGVEVVTAEGISKSISSKTLPHVGGSLVVRSSSGKPEAGARYERLLPVVDVLLVSSDAGISAKLGDLPPLLLGDSWVPVQAPSGASILFRKLGDSKGVEYQIQKGYFQLGVQRLVGWTAVGLTGDRGEVVFDMASGVIDFRPTGTGPAQILLPGKNLVVAGVGSLVQFQSGGAFSSSDFLISAVGGTSSLMDLTTGKEIVLESRNYQFNRGKLSIPGTSSSGAFNQTLALNAKWGRDQAPSLSGWFGSWEVRPGQTREFAARAGQQLSVSGLSEGGIKVTSLAGNFLISAQVGTGVEFELNTGESVTLSSPKSGTLVLKAAASNGREAALSPASGSFTFSPLRPGDVFTFISGMAGEEFNSFAGALAFTENTGSRGRPFSQADMLQSANEPAGDVVPAGSSASSASAGLSRPFLQTPFNQPLAIDVTRLGQPPVSGVGNEQ